MQLQPVTATRKKAMNCKVPQLSTSSTTLGAVPGLSWMLTALYCFFAAPEELHGVVEELLVEDLLFPISSAVATEQHEKS